MDTYSINPDNFKLCILEKGNSTDYYDFNENLISGMSTSTGGNVRELDYQTIMQNYGLPFNFSTVLHMTALDVDFMKEFLKMAIKENESNPIILTYVESSSITTHWKDYTGYESVKYELQENEEIEDKVPIILEGDTSSEDYEKPQDEFITIDNDYMNNNYSSYYYKQQITTNSGVLYVTKADTWLKTTSKEISELQTPIVESGSETNPGVIDYYNEYAKNVGNGQSLITKTTIYVTEKITIETENRRYIVTDGEDKVNVDDFIDLIKKHTGVGGNLVSSDYIILTRLQQYENTQKLEKVMRYVLSMLSGDKYGVDMDYLEYLLSNRAMSSATGGGIIVKTDLEGSPQVLTKEQIIDVIELNYSGKRRDNLLSAIDGLIMIQDKYKVNAMFAIAVFTQESGCGTNWSAISSSTYNWASIKGSYKGNSYVNSDGVEWRAYSDFNEATMDFGDLIANSVYYFSAGNYTITSIGPIYCNAAWAKDVSQIVVDLYESIGITVSTLGNCNEIQERIVEIAISYLGQYMGSTQCLGWTNRVYEEAGLTPYYIYGCAACCGKYTRSFN